MFQKIKLSFKSNNEMFIRARDDESISVEPVR